MTPILRKKRKSLTYRIFSVFISFSFISSSVLPSSLSYAQVASVLSLPPAGTMVAPTAGFAPALMTGLTIHPENPLMFDFIIEEGDLDIEGEELRDESQKLIKYFLAALTVPEEELWVNLSPYEQDRIISQGFGDTEMGRDLLAQDYLLKQLAASLMYPEDELGKEFWGRVYQKANELYGTTEIPLNTFNKIWIVPDKAVVFEDGANAFVIESHLKVMLEEDYVALKSNLQNTKFGLNHVAESDANVISGVTSAVVREVLIPAIEEEVNKGKTFANLRQVYNSMILATWYKNNLKDSLLGQVYADKNKTKGIDTDDKQINQKIYDQYLEAFQKGVYNYIRKDYDTASKRTIPRKYFSGGFDGAKIREASQTIRPGDLSAASPVQIAGALRYHSALNPEARARLNKQFDQLPTAVRRAIPIGTRRGDRNKARILLVENVIDVERLIQAIQPFSKKGQVSSPITPKQLEALNNLFDEHHIDRASREYWTTLWKIFLEPETSPSLLIGNNFIPSALLDQLDRLNKLGMTKYGDMYTESAEDLKRGDNPRYNLTLAILDAGLGTSVARNSLVKELTGKQNIGAKGTDLGFERLVSGKFVSIAEIKLLRLIKEIQKGDYPISQGGKIVFEPIVSDDSKPSYDELLQHVYLEDTLTRKPLSEMRTYGQVLNSLGVEVNMRLTQTYPSLDVDTKEPTYVRPASGSHGEWGFKFLRESIDYVPTETPQMIAFYNGDGTNNMPDKHILRWMLKHNVPITMVFTKKTNIDMKGGQLGIELLEDGQFRMRMLELKGAEQNKQGKVFEKVGLPGGLGQAGEQGFNTNIAVINFSLMAKILQDLLHEVFDNNREELFKILMPDLIADPGKKGPDGKLYIQIEGAIGTVFLNLHNYFMTSSNPKVKEILRRYNVEKIVKIVDVGNRYRTQFFTPVKFAYDHWLQAYSDFYRMDTKRWMLIEAVPGRVPPLFELKNSYYDDVGNMREAFGRTSVIGADKIRIEGIVKLANAILRGEVIIINHSNEAVDLNEHKDLFAIDPDGRLVLDNIHIEIFPDGRIVVNHIVEGYFENGPSPSKASSSPVQGTASSPIRLLEIKKKIDMVTVPFNFDVWIDAGQFKYKAWRDTDSEKVFFQRFDQNKEEVSSRQHEISLEKAFSVGRDPDSNDYSLADPSLSRSHFRIIVNADRSTISIEDRRSANGTYVEVTRVERKLDEQETKEFLSEASQHKGQIFVKDRRELFDPRRTVFDGGHSYEELVSLLKEGRVDLVELDGLGIQLVWKESEAAASPVASSEEQITKDESVGGIDLNPALLNLQIRRDGNGVPLPLPQQPIQNMHIEGFVPIIINIQLVPSTPVPFLSEAEEPEKQADDLSLNSFSGHPEGVVRASFVNRLRYVWQENEAAKV